MAGETFDGPEAPPIYGVSTPGLTHPPTSVVGPVPTVLDEPGFIKNRLFQDTKYIGSGNGANGQTFKLTYSRLRPDFTWRNCEFTHRVHALVAPPNDPAYIPWPGEPASGLELYQTGVPGPPATVQGTGSPFTLIRTHGSRRWLIENCWFHWTGKEHGFYDDEVGPLTVIRNCKFDHCAGQAIQQFRRDQGLPPKNPSTNPGLNPEEYVLDDTGLMWVHSNAFEHNGLAPHGLGRANVQTRFGPAETDPALGPKVPYEFPVDVLLESNTYLHDHGLGTWYDWSVFGNGGTPGAFMVEWRKYGVVRNNVVIHNNQSGKSIGFWKFVDLVVVEGNQFDGGNLEIIQDWASSLRPHMYVLWRNNTGAGEVRIRDKVGAANPVTVKTYNITDDFILLGEPMGALITPTTNFGTWPVFGHGGTARAVKIEGQAPIVVSLPSGNQTVAPLPATAATATVATVAQGSITFAPRTPVIGFPATVGSTVTVTTGSMLIEPPAATAAPATEPPFIDAGILLRPLTAETRSRAAGPAARALSGFAPSSGFSATIASTVATSEIVPLAATAATATQASASVTAGSQTVTPVPVAGESEALLGALVAGSLALSPSPVAASTATADPGVSSPAAPTPASAASATVGSTIHLGSAVAAPAAANASTAALWPTQVAQGSVSIAPAPASAQSATANPATVLTGGSVTVGPLPVTATSSTIFGELALGSISLGFSASPAQAFTQTVGTLTLAALELAPLPATGLSATLDPMVGTSDLVAPIAAGAGTETRPPNVSGELVATAFTATADPAILLSTLLATPAAAQGRGATGGPNVVIPQVSQQIVPEARDHIQIEAGPPREPPPRPIIYGAPF